MSYVFRTPEVGEGVVEVEVSAWHVEIGDRVEVDQPLCEITTDKASMDVASPVAGVVSALHGDVGDLFAVHAPLVTLDVDGTAPAREAPASEVAPAAPARPAPPPASTPVPSAATSAPIAARPAASDPATREATKAAPAVRRRARELGVDLNAVPGTGPGGRVVQADLDSVTHGPAPSRPLPIAPAALPPAPPAEGDQTIKIVGIRRTIATRMVQAKQTAPHFTYVEEVDCARLVDLREQLKPLAAAQGVKLTYLPLWAKAVSLALRDFRNVNAWMHTERGELEVKAAHHLGFACDTPNGLMVPVVRHVERKSIFEIAAELVPLFERTRAGKAAREELSGSTFTITGVGSIGGVLATPILNVPEVGILGVNEIKQRPVVLPDGTIAAHPTTFVSPTFDHRIVDGAVAARFVARLKEIVEAPAVLLVGA